VTSASGMLSNTRNLRIEWCDCDPAGIIFYPRYFEFFDTSTTVLIERALGLNKIEYLKAYAFAGHPLVEARARFRQPTRFGDEVAIETALVECGRSSFKIEHRLSKAGALAVEGFETRVWVGSHPEDPTRIKSQPIPPEVVERFKDSLRP
jgi:4-hydroxybenzoyl-CoA thioesterase